MSRLIDADALIKTLGIANDCQDCPYQSSNFCGRDNDFVVACEAITDAPTIDAVEVVRCKHCKHYPVGQDRDGWVEWPKDEYGFTDDTCPYYCEDGYYSKMPPEDGFCHKGERRGEEDELSEKKRQVGE